MSSSLIVSIIITLLFSAFFSGMEMAFISADRVRLELDNQREGATSNIIRYFYAHTERFISTMLVGNNIALIIYGILMAKLLEPWIIPFCPNDFLVALIQTIASTIIILFKQSTRPCCISTCSIWIRPRICWPEQDMRCLPVIRRTSFFPILSKISCMI